MTNPFSSIVAKKIGKSKEEAQLEKRQELERRLEDVKGQLGTSQSKKTPKKGSDMVWSVLCWYKNICLIS